MKKKLLQTSVALILMGTMSLITGCKTSANYEQADKTGERISSYRVQVNKVKQDVDNTMNSLNQIAMNANTDPRPAFEKFRTDVANLESSAAAARKRGQNIREKGREYFAEWEKQLAQMKNEEVRQLGEKRKTQQREVFDNFRQLADPLNAKFDAWMSDLKDLKTYLGNDLTAPGVDAAKPLFTKAQTDGKEVQSSMDTLIDELNKISNSLTPARVEPSGS